MDEVAVVIVNYNAGDHLLDAVKSVLCSACASKVIVVDNASEDRSMDPIARLAVSELRLMLIQNENNLGFAKACNLGIASAGGSTYFLFLNPDCIIKPGALDKMLSCLKSVPDAAMAGPLLLNTDGTEQAGGRRAMPTPWRSFVRAFGLAKYLKAYPRLFSDFLLHEQPLPAVSAEVEAISGSCMLVRQKAIEQVGPFDEGYFMHCEDLDWCMRFRKQNWKIMFVPDARVIHCKGICSDATPLFVEWHKHKGMMRFYRKFFRHQYPGVLMVMVAAGVWLRFGAVAAAQCARKAGLVIGIGRG